MRRKERRRRRRAQRPLFRFRLCEMGAGTVQNVEQRNEIIVFLKARVDGRGENTLQWARWVVGSPMRRRQQQFGVGGDGGWHQGTHTDGRMAVKDAPEIVA